MADHAPAMDPSYHGGIDEGHVSRGRVGEVLHEGGVGALVKHGWSMVKHRTWLYGSLAFARAFKPRTFTFEGATYRYLRHKYNVTWTNERTVEVPIGRAAVARAGQGRVLEVGNVLSHYGPVGHDCLDKYEKAAGVINQDIVDFAPEQPYDLIVSLSTLEHVGFDETPRDPAKLGAAFERLVAALAPGGRLVVTMPLGYNPEVERLLDAGQLPFTRVSFLRRTSKDNRWVEATREEVRGVKYADPYGAPTMSATAIVVGTYERR